MRALSLTLFLLFLLVAAYGQDRVRLNPDRPLTFVLAPDEERMFTLQLKEGEFAEVSWLANEALNLSFSLYDPSGKDLVANEIPLIAIDNAIPFVARTNGEYRFAIKLHKAQEAGSRNITLQYTKTLTLPSHISESASRKINGYELKIVNSSEEQKSVFLIEKDGRPKAVLKGSGSLAGGFHFSDDIANTFSASERRSAQLVKSTLDKTGDGTPDVAVEYYSGGAHCCFALMFFELGESVRTIPPISTGNAQTLAIGKNPRGGLRLQTGDDTFAYWLTSFAGSPIPAVILEFQGGIFRPNINLMRKPAPSLIQLRNKARTIRGRMSLEPYKGVDDPVSQLEPVFWDEMLELIYGGHEDLAWQYLDLVWPEQKQGKSTFRADFKKQLSRSKFWQMMEQ